MKINMPVTQKELSLSEATTIVSKTDTSGRITYVNRDFLEVSGFTEAELIGQSHNIVRHPDMPPEAFGDLWTSVKAGKPWNGVVKNRCKNGDHYWVEANVAPIREGHQVIGYMSVRTKPSRQQVEEAEALYKQMRAGQMPSVSIIDKFAAKLHDISIYYKVTTAILLPVLAVLGLDYFSQDSSASFTTLLITGVFAAFATSYIFSRKLAKSFEAAISTVNGLAGGDLQHRVNTKANDEFGRLMQAMKAMQIKLGFDVTNSKKIAEESLRLQAALDNSTTAFTFGDGQNLLQYMNKSATNLWKEMSADIKKSHANFSVETMIGNNIGQYV